MESFSSLEESKMPWTQEDVKIAELLLAEEKKIDQNIRWATRMHKAAKKCGYANYNDPGLPFGVKSYIHFKSEEAKKKKSLSKQADEKGNEIIPQTPAEIWKEDLLKNPEMIHGLHPEDEEELIKHLQNEQK